MSSPLVLTTQRNELFHLLDENKLPISQFRWEPDGSQFGSSWARLVHVPTGLYLEARFQEGFLSSIDYSPGPNGRREYLQVRQWPDVMRAARLWAEGLKRELSAPDLWASVQAEREFMAGAPTSASNSPFDQQEKEQIVRSLREIKDFLVNTQELSEGQRVLTSTRLADLEEAANRLGRKDWILIAIGTLMNIVVAAGFNPGQAQALIHFASNSLRWLTTVGKMLP